MISFIIVLGIILALYIAVKEINVQNQETKKGNLNKEYKTLKGDIVKSGGEQRIANYLYSIGVNYEYEKPFYRKDGGENKPDFYLTDYDIYIEYFGMKDHSARYRFEMHLKFNTFGNEHLRVIKIYPTHFKNKTFEKALDVQFKNFTGYWMPKKYNRQIGFYHEKNNPKFIHYYRKDLFHQV